MPTEASLRALDGIRDLTTLQWYVIPLMAIVFYIYAREIKEARSTRNWDAIWAGVTLFGMDFLNETWNGWLFHLTQRSACWTAPGPTALRTMIGWNIEIMFMFALAGLIYYHTLSHEPGKRIAGLPEKWFWAIGYSAFCVLVEVGLNIGGLLIWEYQLWNRSIEGLPLIFLFGYFHFYVAIIGVLALRSTKARVAVVGAMYGLAAAGNAVGLGILGWRY